MTQDKVKVVFIAGWGRSGSTILDSILGEIDGFTSTGEIRRIWALVARELGQCSCGHAYTDCEVWGRVIADNFGSPGDEPVEPIDVFRWQLKATRHRDFQKTARLRPSLPTGVATTDGFVRRMNALYRTVADVAGAGVIVDSSKNIANASLLAMMDGVDPYYVHLVRDPRAVAYSWSRSKWLPDVEEAGRRITAARSSVLWNVFNWGAETLRKKRDASRWLTVRYEDFVERPRQTVEAIVALAGEGPAELPFSDEHTVKLNVRHMVWGNPARFETGLVTIQDDDEWVTKMGTRDRATATAITLPLLRRYGYGLRSGPKGRS